MEKQWLLLITILLFLIFTFLFWKLTSRNAKKGYGTKMWKHWPTRLSYWQAAILYSMGLTAITMFILKWTTILDF
jgi:heme/copper-type cytochrome/quinol oxidase subunit 2